MNIYKTSEIAAAIGVHPNTVRLYEKWELIPKPQRQANGYRVFTDFHIAQFRLARIAFQIEVLQNGLRKKIIRIVKLSAAGAFDSALSLAGEYLEQLHVERAHTVEAAALVTQMFHGESTGQTRLLKRKEVSEYLHISMDTLRNWEMNGLLTVKRKENGYRVYTGEDVRRLKIIRSLRCANYSLEAILQMLCQLSENPDVDILEALNTPKGDTDIITACDKLNSSLFDAEKNVLKMIAILEDMKNKFLEPSTLPPTF